jgi:hypothetical protein
VPAHHADGLRAGRGGVAGDHGQPGWHRLDDRRFNLGSGPVVRLESRRFDELVTVVEGRSPVRRRVELLLAGGWAAAQRVSSAERIDLRGTEELVQVRHPRLARPHDGIVGCGMAGFALDDELGHDALRPERHDDFGRAGVDRRPHCDHGAPDDDDDGRDGYCDARTRSHVSRGGRRVW